MTFNVTCPKVKLDLKLGGDLSSVLSVCELGRCFDVYLSIFLWIFHVFSPKLCFPENASVFILYLYMFPSTLNASQYPKHKASSAGKVLSWLTLSSGDCKTQQFLSNPSTREQKCTYCLGGRMPLFTSWTFRITLNNCGCF